MRKILALSGVVLTSLLISGSAFAQGAPPAPGAPAAEPAAGGGGDEKKMGIGLDAQFLLPLGDLADATGPFIGPLVRFGYRVTPPLEVTLRAGYLFGLSKEQGPVKFSLSNIPIWVGGRYFIMDPGAGLYAGLEIGANILKPHLDPEPPSNPLTDKALESRTRFGFNLAVGYVISKDLPIDIRAQFSHLNLLGTESGETAATAVGASVGYTFSF